MKLTILALMISMMAMGQITFNKDEDTVLSVFVDPTFEDKGFQVGIWLRKELEFGFVGAEISHYEALNPSYTDFIGTVGLNLNIGSDALTIYSGGRGGASLRDGDPHAILGLVMGVDVNLFPRLRVGLRFWMDNRADQEDTHYGDSDGHKEGLIFTGPLTQENAAFVISFEIDRR